MTPLVFGEVLFDCFMDGSRTLGGAPFNVAWHLRGFGLDPLLITRVGTDADGDAVVDAASAWGLRTDAIQRDPGRATGRVDVDIRDGEPHYTIREDAAWDAIEPIAAVPGCMLYHGSLAARSERSCATLTSLRARELPVFVDVNLRPPFVDESRVLSLLRGARWLKLNRSECEALMGELPLSDVRDQLDLDVLVCTEGERGAVAEGESGSMRVTPNPSTAVVDTVGAGDAFAAVLITGFLHDWPLRTCLERAQTFAGRIVQQRGAVAADPTLYATFRRDWQLSPA